MKTIFDPAHDVETGSSDPTRQQGETLLQLRHSQRVHEEAMAIVSLAYRAATRTEVADGASPEQVMSVWLEGVADELSSWIDPVRGDLLNDPAEAAHEWHELRAIALTGPFVPYDWMNVAAHLIEEWIEAEEYAVLDDEDEDGLS